MTFNVGTFGVELTLVRGLTDEHYRMAKSDLSVYLIAQDMLVQSQHLDYLSNYRFFDRQFVPVRNAFSMMGATAPTVVGSEMEEIPAYVRFALVDSKVATFNKDVSENVATGKHLIQNIKFHYIMSHMVNIFGSPSSYEAWMRGEGATQYV